MIIVTGGIKGGVGKTTIACNLAVMRQMMGSRVILVDADEQRSACEFVEQRAALNNGRLPCKKVSGKDALEVVADLSDSYDDVFVDVGGRDTTAQRAAMIGADLVLLPFAVGSLDVWTLPQIETLVSEVRKVNPRLDAVAFISKGYASGSDNRETADMLRASPILRFIDSPLLDRRIYARSAGEGLSVIEVGGKRAAKARYEVLSLYRAIFNADAVSNAA